eukprot:gene463-490_t
MTAWFDATCHGHSAPVYQFLTEVLEPFIGLNRGGRSDRLVVKFRNGDEQATEAQFADKFAMIDKPKFMLVLRRMINHVVTVVSQGERVQEVTTESGVGVSREMMSIAPSMFQNAEEIETSERPSGEFFVHPYSCKQTVLEPAPDNRGSLGMDRMLSRGAMRGALLTQTTGSHSGENSSHQQRRRSGLISGLKSSLKVLVVDDATLNRKMLRRLMSQSTSEVEEACDGREALGKVRVAQEQQQPYDLILMDFQMPVMTGPEAAYQMRKDGFKGWIIGVTGNALDVDLEHFVSQGADRVMTKPISLRALRSIIEDGFP